MALYGVVDTARQRGLYEMVRDTPDHACLFSGPLQPPLERVAPYLVNLSTAERFAAVWRFEWQNHWGIVCTADAALDELRRHFRQFLQSRLPDGRVVMFRFYDPRVFATYLPTCPPGHLKAWFAAVGEFRVAANGGTTRFRLGADGTLAARHLPPAAARALPNEGAI